jgi:LmbE family N-acetylglucosaminyl deacetylase
MLRLLCVTAHPDDEAGGFGGSLLLYGERGIQTHVLCLTPGQAATHRGGASTTEELIATRRREFAASCKLLRVHTAEVLDYPDGGLDRLDFLSVVEDLTRRVREIRPQVVMTFGPEGAVTAHADHGMTSLFTTAAFHWAAWSSRFPEQLARGLAPWRAQKLYYASALFEIPGRQPASLAPPGAVIDIGEYYEIKIAAFHAHASQAPLFPIFDDMMRARGKQEFFHLAASSRLGVMQREIDLFAGVADD